MDDLYEKGYFDAIDDVEAAFKVSAVTRFDGHTFETFNDPKVFVQELAKLKNKRLLPTIK